MQLYVAQSVVLTHKAQVRIQAMATFFFFFLYFYFKLINYSYDLYIGLSRGMSQKPFGVCEKTYEHQESNQCGQPFNSVMINQENCDPKGDKDGHSGESKYAPKALQHFSGLTNCFYQSKPLKLLLVSYFI